MKDPSPVVLKMDFSNIEKRVAAQLFSDKLTGKEVRPILYGMAYGMSAKRLFEMMGDYPLSPAAKLECDILIFERWQGEEAGRIRRENASIAYAAVEAGIISPETGMEAVRAVGAKFPPDVACTPTGRRWSEPEMHWHGHVTGRYSARTPNFEEVDKDHPYPPDGILRD